MNSIVFKIIKSTSREQDRGEGKMSSDAHDWPTNKVVGVAVSWILYHTTVMALELKKFMQSYT